MELSYLYSWAANTRVRNEQRVTPCSQEGAFLHSEGTVTFEQPRPTSVPLCLLHAQYPDAYRYVPRTRVDELLNQAAQARDRWTTQLVIHKGRPPASKGKQYQAFLRHLADEIARVLDELREALPVIQAAAPDSPEVAEYGAIIAELVELLGHVDTATAGQR